MGNFSTGFKITLGVIAAFLVVGFILNL